jgi:hypothetical protein
VTQESLPLSAPSSSPAPAASTSAAPSAPAAASPPPPSSAPPPAAAPPPATATRPEGLPDTYWDATANALKVDPAALVKDLKERDELKAFKAIEDSKRLSLPQSADAYKAELPADFKVPEGITFELKSDDPLMVQAREFAHRSGWSQDTFSAALALHAASQVKQTAELQTAKAAEIAKLGVNGPARVTAVKNWLGAIGGQDAATLVGVLDYAPVAGTVEAFERMMRKFSSQGGADFSQSHRSQPEDGKLPGYDKMSFEQKRFAQDQLRARKQG